MLNAVYKRYALKKHVFHIWSRATNSNLKKTRMFYRTWKTQLE